MNDELTLKVDGKRLSGWTDVSVTLGMQQIPNSFRISATQESPILRDASSVREGQACEVSLGDDLVVTGYVDIVAPGFAPGSHDVQIIGRGKCQDLVDCSAEWKGCQISGANALEIAQKLAEPYGISVTMLGDAAPGSAVPQFNINVTDTPADIIELITRHAALVYYEGADGGLILAELSPQMAGSGFVEGQNIERARWVRSQAQRYSEYVCSLLSVDTSGLFEDQDGLFYHTEEDPNVGRHRRLVMVAEGVMGGLELAKKRAVWEAARRAGRGRSAVVTVDSWRDGKGKLWAPNTLAPVSLPSLGLTGAVWCISEVTFRLGERGGRTADVELLPQEAFQPEPIQLQPQIPGVIPPPADATGG